MSYIPPGSVGSEEDPGADFMRPNITDPNVLGILGQLGCAPGGWVRLMGIHVGSGQFFTRIVSWDGSSYSIQEGPNCFVHRGKYLPAGTSVTQLAAELFAFISVVSSIDSHIAPCPQFYCPL